MPIIAAIVGVGIGVVAWLNGYVDLRRHHHGHDHGAICDRRDHGKK